MSVCLHVVRAVTCALLGPGDGKMNSLCFKVHRWSKGCYICTHQLGAGLCLRPCDMLQVIFKTFWQCRGGGGALQSVSDTRSDFDLRLLQNVIYNINNIL
jgi:hypothetical protein